MDKKKKDRRYPEIKELSEAGIDSFSIFIKEVFQESPEAMWYERLPTESELNTLFNAKLDGCRSGSVIDLVYLSNGKLLCECEIVRMDKQKAIVGIITKDEGKGTGISDMLLQSAEEKAKDMGIKELFAEIKPANRRAIDFFKRNGFRQVNSSRSLVTLTKGL